MITPYPIYMTPQITNGWCAFAQQHLLADHFGMGSMLPRNTIVLHITEGTTLNGALATFEASVAPNRTSAHFIIGQDGTIVQCVSTYNTAWHASQCNLHSIGIEHVALSQSGADALNKRYPNGAPFKAMPCTEIQYAQSARLIKWLCWVMGIPVDRAHIRTHNEASPKDGHVLCCTGALDPDKVVTMAQTWDDADIRRPK